MSELSPTIAAKLAEEIYRVQNSETFEVLLTNPIFSQKKSHKNQLTADVGGRIISKAKDGFGLCAMGAGPKHQGDAFFIFRGTTSANRGADFVTDARIGLQKSKTGFAVHIGFNETFKSMLEDIRKFLQENKITGTIHCIGHSLGGAVALLAADWLKSQTGLTVKLYSFGQPRVGLDDFAKKLSSKLGEHNIHRVFHSTDPVPMIPIYPYVHCPMPGNGHLINSDHKILGAQAHSMTGYVRSVSKKQWLELKRQAPIANFEKGIEEFLTSAIRPDAEHPRTWEWLDSALIFVMKKIGIGIASTINTAFIGINTVADRIAWVLLKGINLVENISHWVKQFIKKVMQILGMPPLIEGQQITQAFLTCVLSMLMRKAYRMARRAVQAI